MKDARKIRKPLRSLNGLNSMMFRNGQTVRAYDKDKNLVEIVMGKDGKLKATKIKK